MKPIISAANLGKKYLIRHEHPERYAAFRDVLARQMKKVFSFPKHLRAQPAAVDFEEFWALKDLNFDIYPGDRVGIIGRNGAGKSTLLKILSRITEPTTGRVELNGRVASLLEVGTGFHPELSGRENIFLNGAILGMSRAEIRRKFDEIVDFAGVEKFLDTPVKRYSSGMYVRLAFAVAAHLEPEILVVDEVLAVGDAEFQKKCLGKMEEVSSKEGRTILFVSHNLAVVQALCEKGVFLKNGKMAGSGGINDLVSDYLRDQHEKNEHKEPVRFGHLLVSPIKVAPATIRAGGRLSLETGWTALQNCAIIGAALLFYNDSGLRVGIIDLRGKIAGKKMAAGESFSINVDLFSVNLIEGEYYIGLYLNTTDRSGDIYDLAHIRIEENHQESAVTPFDQRYRGVVNFNFEIL